MQHALADDRAAWLAARILPLEPGLRGWLRARRVPAHEIDDIVQESYAALAALDDVGHIRDPARYLYATARSIVLQRLRHARIVPIEAVADIDRFDLCDEGDLPERRASAYLELRRMQGLIAALPARCREAFVLRRVDGLSQREIAQRMRISENTVEKHIVKALRCLMDAMRDAPGEEAARWRARRVRDRRVHGR